MFEKTLNFVRTAPIEELKSELAKCGFNFVSREEMLIKSISMSISVEPYPEFDFQHVDILANKVFVGPSNSNWVKNISSFQSINHESEPSNWFDGFEAA